LVRSRLVGFTDYSHQSLADMLTDLKGWIKGITETQEMIKTTIGDLTQSGDWTKSDFDFQSVCGYSSKFFDTAINDLGEVNDGISTEIKEYHVNILFSLAKTAHETNDNAKKVWSNYRNKDYGESVFDKIESLHIEICTMLGDMFDLDNLAHRLKDFIGRKVKAMGNDGKVLNVFNAPITGIQQNFDSSTGTQKISSGTNDLDELRAVIMEIKEILIDIPKDSKGELEDSIIDLEEEIKRSEVKKSKLRAFGGAITTSMKKLFTIQALENAEKISTKLPQVIENFEKILSKMI
jgi:hypothetical protein